MIHKRSFASLLATQTIANAADILYIMSLTVLVLQNTSSLLAAVLIPLLRVGAQMVSSFLAPLLLAKYQLPFLLFISQGTQLLLFTGLAAYLRYASDEPSLILVLMLVFALSFMDGWTVPARNALIPRLASGEQLMKANSLIVLSDRIIQFAGWGLSGLLVAWIGPEASLLLTAACYTASFLFTPLIRDPLEEQGHYLAHPHTRVSDPDNNAARAADQHSSDNGSKNKLSLLREGFSLLASSPALRTLTFIDIIETLGATVWVGAFTLAYVQDVLHEDEAWWGYINAVYFAGTVIGSVGILALVRKLRNHVYAAMLSGMLVYAVMTIFFALGISPLAVLILCLLMGPAAELAYISRQTLIQQKAAAAVLPKIASAQNTIISFTSMISLLILGWAADRFGVMTVYILTAALTICAVTFGYFMRGAFHPSPASANNGVSHHE